MRRCDGILRRDFLRAGVLTALGLGLTDAVRAKDRGRAKRCILVWLDGGPSHLDTFDLKPDAAEEVRGPFRPIETNVPGVRLCEHFRQLSTRMDRACVIRSLTSELGEHNFASHYLLTGAKPSPVLEYPGYAAVLAHTRGGVSELPPSIAVPTYARAAGNGHGYLPAACGPFAVGGDPSRPNFAVRDLEPPPGLDGIRLTRRRDFLDAFDRLGKQVEADARKRDRDAHLDQAYRLILSPEVRTSFDLTRETFDVRQRYGMSRVGQGCLLARRLVEAGCPFVTVTDGGWDTHQQLFRELKEGFTGGSVGKIPRLDQAVAALLDDLSDRGMLDETLVLVMGEFGRTPKLNTSAGRDHWPRAFSVFLAGGGVRGGQVVGKSDPRGEVPAERPVTPTDLARTIYTLLGVDPDRELHTSDGRPVHVVPGGKLVREVLA